MSVGYRRYVFGWRRVIGALQSAHLVTGAALLLALVLAMPVAAQISADPINSRGMARNALAESAGPSGEEPPLPPQGEAGGTTGLPNIQANPMVATSGGLGLFTLETGELLESGWSFSIYGNRFARMPGSVVVSNYGINFGWGYRKWMNFVAVFQPEVATQIGNPAN
jgi:hypothetical protein